MEFIIYEPTVYTELDKSLVKRRKLYHPLRFPDQQHTVAVPTFLRS
jgi:hypothetical protein